MSETPFVPNEFLGRLRGRRLNAVVFSMDYVILWFDGDAHARGNVTLTCDVWPTVERDGRRLRETDPGYGDVLRSLIPQTVVGTSEASGAGLQITFAVGRLLLHPAQEELVGPEIAMLSGFEDGAWMVWRPGEESFEDLA